MTDFLQAIVSIFQATNFSTLQPLGDSGIDTEKYYLLLMIPAIFLIVLLSFTKKRQFFRTDILHGRPGIVYPLNFMGRSKRFLYGAAFGSIGYLCLQMMIGGKYVINFTGPATLRVFAVILSTLVYGIDFYPLFASLAVDSLLGNIIGSVYSLVLAIVFFIQTFRYTMEYSVEILFLNILHSLPLTICLLGTTIAFPVRLFLFQRNKSKMDNTPPLERIQNSYHGLYVKRILTKQESSNVRETSGIWRRTLSYIGRLVYTPSPDFRFSTRMVSVMMTGVIILYVITADTIILSIYLFDKMKADLICWKKNYILCRILDICKECLLVSSIFTFIIGIFNILHSLTSHRSDLLALYKGNHRHIPKPTAKKLENTFLLSASMQYSGYQLAYIGIAYLVQFTVFCLFTGICAVIVHLHDDYFRELLIQWILELLPVIATFVVIMVIQLLLSRYLFLQNEGETLAIDNRRGYFVFVYFMFFYNMYVGIASCVLRILKALVIGLVFLSRLDKSNLPERYQILDPGYKSYVGFMCVESCHTNPIMITFVKLLSLPFVSSQPELSSSNTRKLTLKCVAQNLFDYQEMEEPQFRQISKGSSNMARRRWFLFYTLLNNPQLCTLRKKNIVQDGIHIAVA